MRRPNNLTLDFESNNQLNSPNYWAAKYANGTSVPLLLTNVSLHKKYVRAPFHNATDVNSVTSTDELLSNSTKLTVLNNTVHPSELLKPWEADALRNIFEPTRNVKDAKSLKYFLSSSRSAGRDAYMYKHLTRDQYTKRVLRNSLYCYSPNTVLNNSLNTWENLVNVNFLRKERLYTKLKYSRSPAYDIVSGGAAALLAGFIGFLISEKFGYELVDSGDFYYLFMYAVFAAFSLRPLLTVSDSVKGFWDALSPKRIVLFYTSLVRLVLNIFK
jgi:hypothetical protein